MGEGRKTALFQASKFLPSSGGGRVGEGDDDDYDSL